MPEQPCPRPTPSRHVGLDFNSNERCKSRSLLHFYLSSNPTISYKSSKWPATCRSGPMYHRMSSLPATSLLSCNFCSTICTLPVSVDVTRKLCSCLFSCHTASYVADSERRIDKLTLSKIIPTRFLREQIHSVDGLCHRESQSDLLKVSDSSLSSPDNSASSIECVRDLSSFLMLYLSVSNLARYVIIGGPYHAFLFAGIQNVGKLHRAVF